MKRFISLACIFLLLLAPSGLLAVFPECGDAIDVGEELGRGGLNHVFDTLDGKTVVRIPHNQTNITDFLRSARAAQTGGIYDVVELVKVNIPPDLRLTGMLSQNRTTAFGIRVDRLSGPTLDQYTGQVTNEMWEDLARRVNTAGERGVHLGYDIKPSQVTIIQGPNGKPQMVIHDIDDFTLRNGGGKVHNDYVSVLREQLTSGNIDLDDTISYHRPNLQQADEAMELRRLLPRSKVTLPRVGGLVGGALSALDLKNEYERSRDCGYDETSSAVNSVLATGISSATGVPIPSVLETHASKGYEWGRNPLTGHVGWYKLGEDGYHYESLPGGEQWAPFSEEEKDRGWKSSWYRRMVPGFLH